MTKTTHYITKKQVSMAKTTITLPTDILNFVAHKATQQNVTKSGYIESLVKKEMRANINALLE